MYIRVLNFSLLGDVFFFLTPYSAKIIAPPLPFIYIIIQLFIIKLLHNVSIYSVHYYNWPILIGNVDDNVN